MYKLRKTTIYQPIKMFIKRVGIKESLLMKKIKQQKLRI